MQLNFESFHKYAVDKMAPKSLLLSHLLLLIGLLSPPEARGQCGAGYFCDFSPVCGRALKKQLSQYIINGQPVEPGEFPSFAFLMIGPPEERFYCNGAIVSDFHIMTASHCFAEYFRRRAFDPEEILVFVGNTNYSINSLSIEDNLELGGLRVSTTCPHPNYSPGASAPANTWDIGLLMLSERLIFDDYIQPACLDSTGGWKSSTICFQLGAGFFKRPNSRGEKLPEARVRKMRVNKVNCPPMMNITYELCLRADRRNSGSAPCYGDSGGPVICASSENNANKWTAFGPVTRAVVEDLKIDGPCHSQTRYHVSTFDPKIADLSVGDCKPGRKR